MFYIYDNDGRVTGIASKVPTDGRDFVEVEIRVDPGEVYVVGGELVDKPAMSPTVLGVTISDLPSPCSLTTYGNTYEVLDGTVELLYDMVGDYLVKVEAFPYLDWEVTVNAN